MNKPLVLVLLIGAGIASALVVAALVFGAWLFSNATVDPVPARVEEHEGFEGPLAGRWRAVRGGFTGDQALLPSDAALDERWPAGSVVELLLEADGRYRFTHVEASGTGLLAKKSLVREEGRFVREGAALVLTPTSGVSIQRLGGERSTPPFTVTPPRRYALSSRVMEFPGPPGASPQVKVGLALRGPCLAGPGECRWELEHDDG